MDEYVEDTALNLLSFFQNGGSISLISILFSSIFWYYFNKFTWKNRLEPKYQCFLKMRDNEIIGLKQELKDKDAFIGELFALFNQVEKGHIYKNDGLQRLETIKEVWKRDK